MARTSTSSATQKRTPSPLQLGNKKLAADKPLPVEELMTFAKTQMPLPVDKGAVASPAAS